MMEHQTEHKPVRFTDIGIKKIQAGDKVREIPDPGCAGLYLAVFPSGVKSFVVRISVSRQAEEIDARPDRASRRSPEMYSGAQRSET
jgi:hypothetical protein